MAKTFGTGSQMTSGRTLRIDTSTLLSALHGGSQEGPADSKGVNDAATWVTQLEDTIDNDGLSLQGRVPSFFPPGLVDVERVSGLRRVTGTKLRRLKTHLDPENVFRYALPMLMAF